MSIQNYLQQGQMGTILRLLDEIKTMLQECALSLELPQVMSFCFVFSFFLSLPDSVERGPVSGG